MNANCTPVYITLIIAAQAILPAPLMPSSLVRTGESLRREDWPVDAPRTAGNACGIIREFHELGSGAQIVQDAQELRQERSILLSPARTPQDKPGEAARWKQYGSLLAQARASDRATFAREYNLHSLRCADFLFRQKMCESDLRSCAGSPADHDGNSRGISAFARQAQTDLKSVEEAERALRNALITAP